MCENGQSVLSFTDLHTSAFPRAVWIGETCIIYRWVYLFKTRQVDGFVFFEIWSLGRVWDEVGCITPVSDASCIAVTEAFGM